MDIQHGLMRSLWADDESYAFVEDIMELPVCPICKDGRLLPFSEEKTPFAFWICSLPTCGYTIGHSTMAQTYYKGTAAAQEKGKGDKKWIEYNF